MKSLMVLAWTAAMFSLFCAGCVHRTVPERTISESIHSGGSVAEISAGWGRRFVNASAEDINTLVASPDPGVALAAGWERVLRSAGPFGPGFQPLAALDQDEIRRFITLVEQRLHITPPAAWQRTLLTSVCKRNRVACFFEGAATPDESTLPAGQDGIVRFTDDHHEDAADDRWVLYEQLGTCWSMRIGYFGSNCAVVASDSDTVYTSMSRVFPTPYKLRALKNGCIAWTAQVDGSGDFINYSGTGFHEVTIRISGGEVVVFGVADMVAYIEAFSGQTGQPVMKFCTMYLANRLDPP